MKLTIGKLICIILLIIYWLGALVLYGCFIYQKYLQNELILWFTLGLIIQFIGIMLFFIISLLISLLFDFEEEYFYILDKISDFIYYKIILQIEKFLKTEIKIK